MPEVVGENLIDRTEGYSGGIVCEPTIRSVSEDGMRQQASTLYQQVRSMDNIYFSEAIHSSPQYKYIKSYNYIPKQFNFHKLASEEELYLGVELEIDKAGKDDKNAKLVIDCLGEQTAYCKHDGSLSGSGSGGFEIVTHPCTYEYHQQLPYEDLFKQLSELGYRSHNTTTCGLHVHINRNYLGKDKLTQDLCTSKLLYLFEKYWDKVALVARRDNNHYARRFYLNENESMLDIYVKSKNSNKYGVINLQHEDTVEIRIFKGTLNYRTFMVTLQFVKQITNIIKDVDIYNIQELTWDDIVVKFDSDLIDYINEREKLKKTEKQNQPQYTVSPSSFYTDNYLHGVDFSREYICDFTVNNNYISLENMTVEQVKDKMKKLKRQINRSRNPMERRELQQELGRYSDRLGELRRESRRR